jgi:hypothetical protein
VTGGRRNGELETLRAERAAARGELVRSLEALQERARDPFRLKETIRRHPALSAGVAAGAGALLLNLLAGRRTSDRRACSGSAASKIHRGDSDLFAVLRDLAVKTATPWIDRFIDEHVRQPPAAVPEGNGTEREEAAAAP